MPKRRTLTRGAVCAGAVLFAVGLGACSATTTSSDSMGATPGGAQDNELANTQIEQGGVPRSSALTVEGALNQQDLPLDGPACEKELCISAAYGVAPTLDTDRSAVFVQMGMSSGISAESFVRNPLDLAVVVDRSGSMQGSKIQSVRTALNRLIDQLNEGDRLSVILFNTEANILIPSTFVSNRTALKSKVATIVEGGATDMESGMEAGYGQLIERAGTLGVSSRVIVFTDAQTNTGEVSTSSFVSLASRNAAKGIGLTVFGVGTDLNQDLVLAISQLRGGNYFFLSDADRIATVFDKDFDYLVTPVAYDMKFHLVPAAGFRVTNVYGYPAWATGSGSVDISVSTVFLSRSHGAIVARLEPTGSWMTGKAPLAELSLSYTLESQVEPVSESWSALYEEEQPLDDQTIYYSQNAVRKTVAFVNSALAMRRASDMYYGGNPSGAVELLERSENLLTSEADRLGEIALDQEALRTRQLAENMDARESGMASEYPNYDEDRDDGKWPSVCSVSALTPPRSGAGWVFIAGALAAVVARRRNRAA